RPRRRAVAKASPEPPREQRCAGSDPTARGARRRLLSRPPDAAGRPRGRAGRRRLVGDFATALARNTPSPPVAARAAGRGRGETIDRAAAGSTADARKGRRPPFNWWAWRSRPVVPSRYTTGQSERAVGDGVEGGHAERRQQC